MLLKALKDFFGECFDISIRDITEGKHIFQFGVAHVRIDIITGLDKINFEEAWNKRIIGRYGSVGTNYISKEDLIKIKHLAGRLQDIADIEQTQSLGA